MGSIWIARDEADLGRFAAVSEQSRAESAGEILTVKFVEGDDRRGVFQFPCADLFRTGRKVAIKNYQQPSGQSGTKTHRRAEAYCLS